MTTPPAPLIPPPPPRRAVTFPGQTTAVHIPRTTAAQYANFNRLPPQLRGMMTHVVWLGPNNSLFNFAGPGRGREGVRLATQLLGDQNWPFDLVLTEAPYVYGAEVERVNVNKREFNFGVIIGTHTPPMNEAQYRMAEDNFWNSMDENRDGWIGVYTRFSGWRWCPARPGATVTTAQKMDATAFGNNSSQWDIKLIAARPYYTKPALFRVWQADERVPITNPQPGGPVYYEGSFSLANRGDLPSPVTYLISSPGMATVQDNYSDRMVELPQTSAHDGTYMCDTEHGHRTLTASADPIDNIFYKIIRSSQLLDFLLHDLASLGLPLQLRFNNRFLHTVPPQTVVNLTVRHTNPAATIVAFLPQRFKRSR